MRSLPSYGLYLDQRRELKDGSYPIKLRITFERKTKYFRTPFSVLSSDFKKVLKGYRLNSDQQRKKELLDELLYKAKAVVEDLNPFTFQEFEVKFYDRSYQNDNVLEHYDSIIEELKSNNQVKTMLGYRDSKHKIAEFFCRNRNAEYLSFFSITPNRLKEMREWYVSGGGSETTVGIYLRYLRRVFNDAIENGEIPSSSYPFGRKKGKFSIPTVRKRKAALCRKDIVSLIQFQPPIGSYSEFAKDFFLLSFYCQGINFNDLLRLKIDNYSKGVIVFKRRKTKGSVGNLKEIEIIVPEEAARIIDKYRTDTSHDPNEYFFPYLIGLDSEVEKKRVIDNFTRKVNQHLKKLAKQIDLPDNISPIWARHTYATHAKRSGVSHEFISEALGHTDLRTTQNYLDSFETDYKREIAKQIFIDLK